MNSSMVKKIEYLLNMLAVLGISALFIIDFIFQFVLHELPCPLCLLQRVGFTLIAMGFLFNLRFGLRPSHYAIVLLSTIYTAFVALRQVLLHIVPGTGDYGPAIFGLHMYTWSFVLSVIIIIATTLMLGVDRQYEPAHINNIQYKKYIHAIFVLFFILTLTNAIATWAQCGWQECPDNPTGYVHSL